jgi:hypothetical protein
MMFQKFLFERMPIDVISNRDVVAKARDLARRIPFFWSAYFQYWKARRRREWSGTYLPAKEVVSFGDFPAPDLGNPCCQLCTAEQMTSDLYDRWCRKMHSPPRFSRKQWEFVYILEVLSQSGCLAPGKKGIGFGCGREPLVGLFASYGCHILATDLDTNEAREQGWMQTGQHAGNLDLLYDRAKEFCCSSDFYSRVQFRNVDMNHVPPELYGQFDFTWSACCFEHLGSLRHGIDFVRNSSQCLKPGGVAVHTTEFNLSSKADTMETPSCSIYRESDIRALLNELQAGGFETACLNLNTGGSAVDKHIDVPPYGFSPHLKLLLDKIVVTSIGIIVRKY